MPTAEEWLKEMTAERAAVRGEEIALLPHGPFTFAQVFCGKLSSSDKEAASVQIRQILGHARPAGESLIFGHFAPEGDVLKLNEGWSRVRCPTCQSLGPVRASFREACEGWNALTRAPAARR